MLGKLLKHEWRGYRFPLLIMLIILFSTTLLTCGVILSINPKYDEVLTGYSVFALMLSVFLYYFGLIGCSVGTMLIIAIRFYKTCYTDQGYLTHTLPVSSKLLFNAKALSAMLVYLLMLGMIAVTIFMIIGVGIHHAINVMPYPVFSASEIWESIKEEFVEAFGFSFEAFVVYMLFYALIASLSSVITTLGCVSLGQLYAKHRIVGAIIAYFAVQIVQSIAGYISIIPTYAKMFDAVSYEYQLTFLDLYYPTFTWSLIVSVITAVAMYFINLHMMTKKLNLE